MVVRVNGKHGFVQLPVFELLLRFLSAPPRPSFPEYNPLADRGRALSWSLCCCFPSLCSTPIGCEPSLDQDNGPVLEDILQDYHMSIAIRPMRAASVSRASRGAACTAPGRTSRKIRGCSRQASTCGQPYRSISQLSRCCKQVKFKQHQGARSCSRLTAHILHTASRLLGVWH